MAQHTSGPWTTDIDRRFRAMDSMQMPESIGVRGPDGNFLASAFDFNRTDRDAEVEANARLIAAAPDLLAALEHIVAINGSTGGHKAMVADFKHIAQVAIDRAQRG
jgi:hypothetical protein